MLFDRCISIGSRFDTFGDTQKDTPKDTPKDAQFHVQILFGVLGVRNHAENELVRKKTPPLLEHGEYEVRGTDFTVPSRTGVHWAVWEVSPGGGGVYG